MPKIVLPFSFINFASGDIVIYSMSVLHLIYECSLVLIAIAIVINTLNECGSIDSFTLKAISIGIMNKWWRLSN